MDIGWFVCGFMAGVLALLLIALAGTKIDEWKEAKKSKEDRMEDILTRFNSRLGEAETGIRNLKYDNGANAEAARKYAVSYTDASLRVHETEFHAPKTKSKKAGK